MKISAQGEREAARILASALRQDATAQEASNFEAIANRYDDVYAEVLPLCSDLPDIAASYTLRRLLSQPHGSQLSSNPLYNPHRKR